MRSTWKVFTSSKFIYRNSFQKKIQTNEFLKLWVKNSKIFLDLLGKKINIYNGTKFISLTVKKEMWGKVLGEFILTKRISSDIHFKKSKSKNKTSKRK